MDIVKLEVCTDCINYIANGETSPDMGADYESKLHKTEKHFSSKGYSLAFDGKELGFCCSACDLCGGCAGDRFKANAINRAS